MEITTFRTEIEQRIVYAKQIADSIAEYEGRIPDYWDGKVAALKSLLHWLNGYNAAASGQEHEDEGSLSE